MEIKQNILQIELPPLPEGYDRWEEMRGHATSDETTYRLLAGQWQALDTGQCLATGVYSHIHAVKDRPMPVVGKWYRDCSGQIGRCIYAYSDGSCTLRALTGHEVPGDCYPEEIDPYEERWILLRPGKTIISGDECLQSGTQPYGKFHPGIPGANNAPGGAYDGKHDCYRDLVWRRKVKVLKPEFAEAL